MPFLCFIFCCLCPHIGISWQFVNFERKDEGKSFMQEPFYMGGSKAMEPTGDLK